jgi:hypothetical protein
MQNRKVGFIEILVSLLPITIAGYSLFCFFLFSQQKKLFIGFWLQGFFNLITGYMNGGRIRND